MDYEFIIRNAPESYEFITVIYLKTANSVTIHLTLLLFSHKINLSLRLNFRNQVNAFWGMHVDSIQRY